MEQFANVKLGDMLSLSNHTHPPNAEQAAKLNAKVQAVQVARAAVGNPRTAKLEAVAALVLANAELTLALAEEWISG